MPKIEFVRPRSALYLAEGSRLGVELLRFWTAFPALAAGPRGDGHPVLVLPGFLADDSSTRPLTTLLYARGYRPEPWGLGRNLGPTEEVLQGLTARLIEVSAQQGRRVSIVGWSLGGFYARDLGRERPDLVRSIITLGSPVELTPADGHHTTYSGPIYQALRPMHSPNFDRRPRESAKPPLSLPNTSIYSKTDGVVPWRACLTPEGHQSENVAVESSHCGFGLNVSALGVVLDRLAQPEGSWTPYRHSVA